MRRLRQSLSRLRLFHWCLIALAPLAILIVGLRLDAFPRANWAIKRAVALTIGPRLHLTRNLAPARARLRAAAGPQLTLPLADPRIVILKSRRLAELYAGDKLIKSYKIVLGESPEGHKTKIGDGRTPEGRYHICTCLYRSSYHIFLGLNYPSARDGEAGLSQQLISADEARGMVRAERKGRKPPWNTLLGGAVGLHGGGTATDWTDGCLALSNPDIEELCLATRYWTPVEIRP